MAEEDTFDDMAEDLFDTLCQDATYKPITGNPVSCKVNLDLRIDSQPIGYDTQAWATGKTLEYRFDEIGQQANRGDVFTVDSVDYTVQAVIEGDSRFVKVSVK